MNIEILKKVIFDSSRISANKVIERGEYFPWLVSGLDNDFINVISGFRRTGKSFLLKQLKNHLISEKEVSEGNIFFVNFEHDLLENYRTVKDLRNMLETFEIEIAEQGQKIFLFLDEIQNVPQWEKFIRTLYDSNKTKYSIYLTGSNSSLLSSEFSSALGGRTIERQIHPFDFKEYLNLSKFDTSSLLKSTFGKVEHKIALEKHLKKYLTLGGLPETIERGESEVRDYIKNIFNKILLDDIIKRFNIEKVLIIEKLFYFLISNIGSVVSFTNIAGRLISERQKISVPTLQKYTHYYEQSFALKKIRKFDWRTKEIFDQQYKFYTVDNSLITFLSLSMMEDKREVLLENIVANTLFKRFDVIYYGRDSDGKEIDFIIQQGSQGFLKVQVTVELNDDNLKRELGNFILADKYLKSGKGILITLNGQSQKHFYKGVEIQEITLLDFLLDEFGICA